ncbi:MAG: oligosaccharide flippase family protein, partial [archaeon]|nr:oligosaccharide flippase family protein [archaeon]
DDYGTLAVLISVLAIFYLLFSAIGSSLTKFVAGLAAKKEQEKISYLAGQYYRLAFFAGVSCFAAFFALQGVLAGFFHIEDTQLVVFTGAGIALSAFYAVAIGTLNGLQKFAKSVTVSFLQFGSKLAAGIALVLSGFGVAGALYGIIVGLLVGIIAGVLAVFPVLKNKKKSFSLKTTFSYSGIMLGGVVFLAFFNSVDIFLVKHFFPAGEAGVYAAALQAARMVFYLVSALSVVLLAKSSALHEQKKQTGTVFLKVTAVSIGLSMLAILPYFLAPDIFVAVFFGGKYAQAKSFLGILALAMGFYVLSNIMVNYFISLHRKKFVYVLGVFALMQWVAISVFHSSLEEVALIVLASNILLTLALAAYSFVDKKVEYWTESA